MEREAAGGDAVGAHEEAAEAALARRRVRRADPEPLFAASAIVVAGIVIAGEVRAGVQAQVAAPTGSHRAHARRGTWPAWNEWKRSAHAAPRVVAVQLRVAIVVADQHAAANAPDLEDRRRGRPACSVRGRPSVRPIAGAEALVVAVDDRAARIDHVDAVVRLVPPARRCVEPRSAQIPSSPAIAKTSRVRTASEVPVESERSRGPSPHSRRGCTRRSVRRPRRAPSRRARSRFTWRALPPRSAETGNWQVATVSVTGPRRAGPEAATSAKPEDREREEEADRRP